MKKITQAKKKIYIIQTDKTVFFVWDRPDIENGDNLYITFCEETIMPTMSVEWIPYLIIGDKKHRVNEEYTDDNFYTDITYSNLESVGW